jgi:hypothetical protein
MVETLRVVTPKKMSIGMLTSLEWGIVTCLLRLTLNCEGSPIWGPSPNHHGVAPVVGLGYES